MFSMIFMVSYMLRNAAVSVISNIIILGSISFFMNISSISSTKLSFENDNADKLIEIFLFIFSFIIKEMYLDTSLITHLSTLLMLPLFSAALI